MTDEIQKQLAELNDKIADNKGQWIYAGETYGIVWQPSAGDQLGVPPSVPIPSTPPSLLRDIVEWGKTYDFDNVSKNAVVLIKLNITDPMRAQMLQRVIAKQVLEPRIDKLKENRVCILFVGHDDDISVMTEEEMGQAGWEKKDKQRIITLS